MVQVFDSGERYLHGSKQHCQVVVVWGEDGKIKEWRIREAPVGAAPAYPIQLFSYAQGVRRLKARRTAEELTPEQRKARHAQSARDSRRRIKEGQYLRPRKETK